MTKKLVALAAGALCSLNATAGYIQYDLNSPGLSGYIVQNEEDMSIAYFELRIGTAGTVEKTFAPYNGYADIAWAEARYNNQGPARFGISDTDREGFVWNIWFDFSGTGDTDTYRFISHYAFEQVWSPFPWYRVPPVVHYPSGTATRTTVDPDLVASLDYYLRETGGERYDWNLHRVVPAPHVIPEPAGIALLALGAAGLAAARRRKALR